MKRVTKTVLPVHFGIDLDTVASIKFVFEQSIRRKTFEYPSDTAQLAEEEDTINLIWETDETAMFSSNNIVRMDTFITLKDSEFNPETNIVEFRLNPSLFTVQEVEPDD